MLPSFSQPKTQKNTTVSPSKKPNNVCRFASQEELYDIRNIILNVQKCNAQICDFRTNVENKLRQLRIKGVSTQRLTEVSLSLEANAKYFASAFCLLQSHLQNHGLDIPKIGDIDLLLESFRLSPEKQAHFFHQVKNFFDPDAPYLKEKIAIKQQGREEENHIKLVLPLFQLNQLFYKSREQLAYIREKMHALSQIFFKMMEEFVFAHGDLIFAIYSYLKDSQAESILLEKYAFSIHKMVKMIKQNESVETSNKSNACNSPKCNIFSDPPSRSSQYPHQKPITQVSIAQQKRTSSQSNRQLHLNFIQKAFNYLQALFHVQPVRKQNRFTKEEQQLELIQHKQQ